MKEKQKKILYFTRTMNLGGTEKVVLQLCETMRLKFDKIVVCSCGGVNVEKLNEMGIKHYLIPDIEKKDIKTIIKVLKVVSKIIKVEDINVIHTHHRMAAFYARILSFTKNFTFVHSAHNTFYDKKGLTKFALKHANIVAVGNKVEDNLCYFYGIPKSHIKVIYNSVEPFEGLIKPIEILQKYKNEGYFLVGNIGRLSKQKGIEYFVKAVPLLLKEHKKTKFFIVGDGEDKEKIQKLVFSLHLEDNVIFLGYRNDIQNVMSQLDLIVLSSLWEGLPLTPIEAFSVGKTIVATAVDGTVEIVKDGTNGLLVESRNSFIISDKIIHLINNKEYLNKLSMNAKKTYEEKFSFENLAKNYLDYYNSLA